MEHEQRDRSCIPTTSKITRKSEEDEKLLIQ